MNDVQKSLSIPAAIIVAGLIIAGAIILTNKGSVPSDSMKGQVGPDTNEPADEPPVAPPEAPSVVDVSVDDDPVLGDANAPVTIIEFSDFQCPYCARAALESLTDVKKNYIDTGKAKLVYRDFPLGFHSNAQKAAEAAECADEQGKFWAMHDKIFENQSALAVSDLKKYASDLGLDTGKFNSCLDSDKYAEEVKKDAADGQAAGVTGTPSFFINGELLVGAQPYEQFKSVIDSKLE